MSLWNWSRSRRERDLNRELQSHLELEEEEQLESGLSDEDARYTARRALGNSTLVAEQVRESWGWVWLEKILRDLRYGCRTLRKSPGFTAVAVLTLALGIGANTAVFSVVDALMLRPLPFSAPDQLVRIYSIRKGLHNTYGNPDGPSLLDVGDFAQRNRSFQKMVAYDIWRKNVSFGDSMDEPEQMRIGLVPAAYFEILDIQPILGRLFTEDENREGNNYVAAVSARLWRERFAGDKAILGRKIVINEEPYRIVAVIPDVIPKWMEQGGTGQEIWTPLALPGVWQESESARGSRGWSVLARLKPGVTLEQAQADLSVIATALAAAHPSDEGVGVAVKKLADTRVGALRPMLFLLTGAVSLILLIACVNLANLLLARNSARQRELAVRTALGSGRAGLMRQLLAEALLLSLIGSAVGFVLAQLGVRSLSRILPADLPQLASMTVDWRMLTFTLLVSVATTLLFGVVPALAGTRLDPVDTLKQGGRTGTGGKGGGRMRALLVVAEMAMSFMLLVAASLLVQSMLRLEHQSLGIRQDHLLKGAFYLPAVRYPDPRAITRFCDEFAGSVRGLPGVTEATVTTIYPPKNGWTQMLNITGHPVLRLQDIPAAQFGVADAHFRKALGIPLIQGRDFSESDIATSPPVALISEELMRRYFPAENPVGRRIHIGPPQFLQIPAGENTTDATDVTVIGVVGDFKNNGLVLPPEPQITVLYSQHPLVNYGFKDIVIRTASEPRLLAPAIRRQLYKLDPNLPLSEVETIDEHIEEQTGGNRFTAALMASFAIAGLALAIVGNYGVTSYLMTQRTRELAMRMALGASRAAVLWLVVRQGLGMATRGAALGLCGAWAAQKLMGELLFGISPLDSLTLIGGALFLLTVAAIASAIPGARVRQIDLAGALRQD